MNPFSETYNSKDEMSLVHEAQEGSQKALEKIGARFLRKAHLPARDGTLTPNLVFAITRDSWI